MKHALDDEIAALVAKAAHIQAKAQADAAEVRRQLKALRMRKSRTPNDYAMPPATVQPSALGLTPSVPAKVEPFDPFGSRRPQTPEEFAAFYAAMEGDDDEPEYEGEP